MDVNISVQGLNMNIEVILLQFWEVQLKYF